MPIKDGIFYDDVGNCLFYLGDNDERPRVTFEVLIYMQVENILMH